MGNNKSGTVNIILGISMIKRIKLQFFAIKTQEKKG